MRTAGTKNPKRPNIQCTEGETFARTMIKTEAIKTKMEKTFLKNLPKLNIVLNAYLQS